ncbi:chromophore lyase CpcT/CpeT [Roseivirga sp. BDSF3-8]|uniref:chromophore lyase CpcT/CpeT n=1 Tax=Roseivirga sp. BDSF3-8 TaxID=3241598 RepID=UPI0035327338
MKKKLILFICCFAAALMSLALQVEQEDPELDRLAAHLTGHFHSGAQAAADSSYFEIHLHSERIWPMRRDGHWLYVEQAAAGSLGQPYRQRVYQVMRDSANQLVSLVYELPEPQNYIGAYKKPGAFEQLSPRQLLLRKGCEVWIEPSGNGFMGETQPGACGSSLRGASYATSMVRISSDSLHSWDRGYNHTNQQVWGAEKGAYVFVRQ